jgi:hypothetical protein
MTADEATSSESVPLDHILESAVVINWSDLVRGAIPGLATSNIMLAKSD